MVRRVVEHLARTNDCELLQVITIFEEGFNKQDIRKINPYCKKHAVLVKNGNSFQFIQK